MGSLCFVGERNDSEFGSPLILWVSNEGMTQAHTPFFWSVFFAFFRSFLEKATKGSGKRALTPFFTLFFLLFSSFFLFSLYGVILIHCSIS